ncbi:unnamed protein product [Rotaria magnacalcarata]|uniref:U-box domain-containing protein n=4 Tax=Rotaria magnacalcarata TaxID=392030 RepID=A0A816H7T3_9BILA|nr:unnamed protein product [Rotaria magnacalcarata]CAF1684102.1 unnamed protein product [Rotaria magnacalcarata]
MLNIFSKINSYFRKHKTTTMSEQTSIPNSNQPSPHHTPATIAVGAQSSTLATLVVTQSSIPQALSATHDSTSSISVAAQPVTPSTNSTIIPTNTATIPSPFPSTPTNTSTAPLPFPSTPTNTSTAPLPFPSTPTAASTNSLVFPTASATSVASDDYNLFSHAYECAKNNYSWHKVTAALEVHPEWLTKIPQGRRWTILHQIVYFGNIAHLNEALGYQILNDDFRLLCKTSDDKTVREVATERAHINPQMLRRIERLVAIDQLLNNARDGKWELVKQFLRQQPDIINEKPPYRKFYLAHFLAATGQLDIFKDLMTICLFKLDLIAEDKTINQIARDNNHIEFAEFIEHLPSQTSDTDNEDTPGGATGYDSDSPNSTPAPTFSQGFYDDPGIMIFSVPSHPLPNMPSTQNGSLPYPSHYQHFPHSLSDFGHSGHSLFPTQMPTTITMMSIDGHQNLAYEEHSHENHKKSESSTASTMSEEEQQSYEKTVMENIKKFSSQNLLSAVTCCITKCILKDPVLAADGFTYEREAIVNWFKNSNRSPMTNQELENKELKTNHAIKSILQTLCDVKKEEKNV